MANGDAANPARSHTRFIVGSITILGLMCGVAGATLIFKGYHGDLFIGGTLAAISGLVGLLSVGKPQQQPQDITVSTQPPSAHITQPEQTK